MGRKRRLALVLAAFCAARLASAAPVDCDREPERALPTLQDRALAHGSELAFTKAITVLFPPGALGKMLTFKSDEHESFMFTVVVRNTEAQRRRPRSYFLSHMWEEAGRRHRWMYRADLSGKLVDAVSFRDVVDDQGNIIKGSGTEIYRRGPNDAVAREQFAKDLRAACFIANEHPESSQEKLAAAEATLRAMKAGKQLCDCTCAFNHKKTRHVVKELTQVACGTCDELCAPYVKNGIAELKRSLKKPDQP